MSNIAMSRVQESEIAKYLDGKTQSNSGGTKFGGGDVHLRQFLIEAKTPYSAKHSFTVKSEMLSKAEEQAFEQGKQYWSLAFRCEPEGPDYFIISKQLFKRLVKFLDNELDWESMGYDND